MSRSSAPKACSTEAGSETSIWSGIAPANSAAFALAASWSKSATATIAPASDRRCAIAAPTLLPLQSRVRFVRPILGIQSWVDYQHIAPASTSADARGIS